MKPKLVLTGEKEPAVSWYRPDKRYPPGFIRMEWKYSPLTGLYYERWGLVIGETLYRYRWARESTLEVLG